MSELAGYTSKELSKELEKRGFIVHESDQEFLDRASEYDLKEELENRGYTVIDDDAGDNVYCEEEIACHIKSRYDQVHLWIQSIRCGETTIEGFYADQVKELIYDMTNTTIL